MFRHLPRWQRAAHPRSVLRPLTVAIALAIAPVDLALAQVAAAHRFDLPAGPLDVALTGIARRADSIIVVDPALVRGRQAPAVQGELTLEEAFARALDGTGLQAVAQADGSYTLVRAAQREAQLAPVRVRSTGIDETATSPVNGYVATRSATGTKTDLALLETPQAINVVTADEIAARGAQNLGQALRYTPGIASQMEGGSEGRRDSVYTRGFYAAQYVDGLPVAGGVFGYGVTQIEPYGLERVDVLKGPASVLFGRNAPGGLVNGVSKRPTSEPYREVAFSAGSFDRVQGAFDVSDALGDSVRFRVAGLTRDSGTELGESKDDRDFIAPSLSWTPREGTRLTLLATYQKDEANSFQQAPAEGSYFPNPLGEVDGNRYWGVPDYDRYKREFWSVGYEFEHRFNEHVQIRQNLRVAEVKDDMRWVGPWALIDYQWLERYAMAYKSTSKVVAVDTQAVFDFETGALDHQLLAGLDHVRHTLRDGSYSDPSMDPPSWGGTLPLVDIFNPDLDAEITPGEWGDGYDQVQRQRGVYVQDRIRLGNWIALLGLRHDRAEGRSSYFPDPPESTSDDELTTRIALTYVFDSGVAPYLSYSESFSPTAGRDVEGKPFEPTTGTQYEFGVKYQPDGVDAFVSAAAFEITQQNVLTPDPFDPFAQVQTGEARVRGIELEGKANPLPGLDLVASYAYLDSEVTESSTEAELGEPLPWVSRRQGSVWAAYTLQRGSIAPGLGFGIGARYTSRYYSNLGGAYPIDALTLYDASISYDFGLALASLRGLTLNVAVQNLSDKEYLVSGSDWAGNYGQGRTVYGTLAYRW